MRQYQLNQPSNQKVVEDHFIHERIDLLSERQWQLTGDDFRRCQISIDYNRRLLDDRSATVIFTALS